MVGSSKSENSSSGSNSNQSQIDSTQKAYLDQLWGKASSDILGGSVGAAKTQVQQDLMGQVMNNPFGDQLKSFSQPNNQMVQQNVDMLGQNLQKQLQNSLMPQIADQSIQSGGFGGGRQGIAQGLALQGTQDAFAQGALGIQNNAYNQANQATQFGSNFNLQSAMGGMGMLGQAQQQEMTPFLTLAQILGSPTVLNSGKGKTSGSGSSSGWSILGG